MLNFWTSALTHRLVDYIYLYFIVMAFDAACKFGVGCWRSFRRVRVVAPKALSVLSYGIMYFRIMPDGIAV